MHIYRFVVVGVQIPHCIFRLNYIYLWSNAVLACTSIRWWLSILPLYAGQSGSGRTQQVIWVSDRNPWLASQSLRRRRCGSAPASSWTRSTSERFQSCRSVSRSNTPSETLVSFSTADSLWPTMSLLYVALATISSAQWYVSCQLMAPRQWHMPSFRADLTTATRFLLASLIACFVDCSRSRMRPPVLLPAPLAVNTSRRYSGNFIDLPVLQRVRYKLATLAFRSLSGQAPVYLTDDCQLVAESGRRTLRSAERSVRVIQRCNNTFGDRSFAVAGPRAWNDLPVTLRNTELTMGTFCRHLKTVLFTDSWGRGAFVTFWFYSAVYKCSYFLTYTPS